MLAQGRYWRPYYGCLCVLGPGRGPEGVERDEERGRERDRKRERERVSVRERESERERERYRPTPLHSRR